MNQLSGEDRSGPTPQVSALHKALKDVEPGKRQTLLGYLYDRDVVAFYGDPKWDARLDTAKTARALTWDWTGKPGHRALVIQCAKDFKKDELLVLLPERMKAPKSVSKEGLDVTVNDKFVWIAKPDFTAGKSYRIEIPAS